MTMPSDMNTDPGAPENTSVDAEPSANFPPSFNAVEARVMGCLVEKQATTPDTYPLTLNALTTACNQKTSRDPVMNLSQGEVGHALRTLESRKLVQVDMGARASRYDHRFANEYSLTKAQQALLAVLMLRGAQTAGELMTRCERIFAFDDLALVEDTLDRLSRCEPALVENIGRAGGQREDRYMHRLTGQKALDAAKEALGQSSGSYVSVQPASELLERIETLEAQVALLTEKLKHLE